MDDTVAAAGHPDAEEVMKGEMEALKPSPATKFPHADDISKATTLDEAEPVTDRAAGSRSPKGETDSATELPNEDLTWAGRVAEGSSAEATAAAAGHSDAAEVMVDDLSTRITEPDENLSPVDRLTKESTGDETTVVAGDQDAAEKMETKRMDVRVQPDSSAFFRSSVKLQERTRPPVTFTAETALVSEVDVLLPDR